LIESFLESGCWLETTVGGQAGRIVDLPGRIENVLDCAQRAALEQNGFIALGGPIDRFAFAGGLWSCSEARTGHRAPSLAPILNASRILQSVARVAAETGGRSMTREEYETLLNEWIAGCFRAAGAERFWPEAAVRIEETPEAGRFRAVLELQPGSRLVSADAGIRWAVDLPGL
jgi:hypothetical protein